MQRARCYLIGETAVVLELEPPVTLASQKRIWRLAQRLVDMPNVLEAIPGMNNITVILRNPESLACFHRQSPAGPDGIIIQPRFATGTRQSKPPISFELNS